MSCLLDPGAEQTTVCKLWSPAALNTSFHLFLPRHLSSSCVRCWYHREETPMSLPSRGSRSSGEIDIYYICRPTFFDTVAIFTGHRTESALEGTWMRGREGEDFFELRLERWIDVYQAHQMTKWLTLGGMALEFQTWRLKWSTIVRV